VFSNLTPFIPLSFEGEGEDRKKRGKIERRGVSPLLDAPDK
jgi:hypothetical protein